jgi:hypothetical protein
MLWNESGSRRLARPSVSGPNEERQLIERGTRHSCRRTNGADQRWREPRNAFSNLISAPLFRARGLRY